MESRGIVGEHPQDYVVVFRNSRCILTAGLCKFAAFWDYLFRQQWCCSKGSSFEIPLEVKLLPDVDENHICDSSLLMYLSAIWNNIIGIFSKIKWANIETSGYNLKKEHDNIKTERTPNECKCLSPFLRVSLCGKPQDMGSLCYISILWTVHTRC